MNVSNIHEGLRPTSNNYVRLSLLLHRSLLMSLRLICRCSLVMQPQQNRAPPRRYLDLTCRPPGWQPSEPSSTKNAHRTLVFIQQLRKGADPAEVFHLDLHRPTFHPPLGHKRRILRSPYPRPNLLRTSRQLLSSTLPSTPTPNGAPASWQTSASSARARY